MKKILGFLFLAAALFLTGCDSACAIETTAEDGTATVMNVSKTEDAQEVAKVISVLNEKMPAEEDLDFSTVKCAVKLNFQIIGRGEAKGSKLAVSTNSSVEADIRTNTAYADVNLSVSYADGTAKEELKLDSVAYTDSLYAYVDGSLKYNGSSQTVKNRISMADLTAFFGSVGDIDSIPDLGDFDLPELSTEAQIQDFIEEYGITISSTSKSTITFKASVPVSEQENLNAKAELFLEIDVRTMLPKYIKVNAADAINTLLSAEAAAEMECKACVLEFKLNFSNDEVKTLSDGQKSAFIDLPLTDSGYLL